MRVFCTFIILFCFHSFSKAQVLIIPSDVSIKKPKMKLFQESALYPGLSQLVGGETFFDRNTYYSKLVTENMNHWLESNFDDAVLYQMTDSIVDLNKLQGAILREYPIYESYKSKPIFGRSGNFPTEGANTKEILGKLREEYQVDYVVWTFVNSILADDLFIKNEFPEYRGHSVFYSVVLNTKTGHIEVAVKVKDKEQLDIVNSNQLAVLGEPYRPIYKNINDKYIVRRCEKLQAKLKRRMKKLN